MWLKISTLFCFVILFLFINPYSIYAKSLVIKSDGRVLFLSDNGSIDKYLFLDKKLYKSNVLGASSGIIITVSVSSFIPTDTPIPSPTLTPTSTPSPTPTSAPNSTPTPTNSPESTSTPTPTSIPENTLIATITSPTDSTTQSVDEIIMESINNGTLTITPATSSGNLVITQGDTQTETSLPVQLDTTREKINVVIDGKTYEVIAPVKVIDAIKTQGSFIIPSSITSILKAVDNKPVYVVSGLQNFQILGLLTLKLPISIHVSAENGNIIAVNNPALINILEFLRLGQRVIK
ncbi:MAG TPA: hypothetical protein VG917_01730 [Patescibacteria group bacterium]|nr:hypothetical protein [Patescibacteria group bacterium]